MDNISSFLGSLVVNLLLFVIPVFLYLKLKDKVNPLIYLKILGDSKKGIAIGIGVSAAYIILLLGKNSITQTKHINLDLGLLWISTLLVGLIEEIPFRGFLLQKLSSKMNFWKANLLTTIIFILCHIPTWIFTNPDILKSVVNIAIVSLAFGYLFKEYKSLWITIICHSVFNLSIWMGL
ncbi:CPBP family intramembrane glutamic endopeptidase [Clostridium sp. C2-6-12]|uniref:CPBP family intramembrane glutamic endopeptidase n=1 Tax=Clostridium sp. C2-6-12 TaxID=2698832 RepID=UPI00136DDC59|nr:CPBP family intramembrane glutamic endopeptidase [Clostridium sp. C2-6-12]